MQIDIGESFPLKYVGNVVKAFVFEHTSTEGQRPPWRTLRELA